MKQLQKILVPVDINSEYQKQIEVAVKLADIFKSEIILMYVVPADDLNEDVKDIIIRSVTETLHEIRKIFLSNYIKVKDTVISFGNIVETIIQKGDLERVNLIFLGARNKKINEKYHLGVISEQIIQKSEVPVCVIKPDGKNLVTNILCPVDFSEPSGRALNNAILLAKKFEAALHILTVYEPILSVSGWIHVDLDEENAKRLERVQKEMLAFISQFDLEGVNYKIEVETGNIEELILTNIDSHHIDLLIMGTHGRTGLSHFIMGSVTKKVTREMPCSFITMKPNT